MKFQQFSKWLRLIFTPQNFKSSAFRQPDEDVHMPNATTNAFRKMMLTGRINEIMTEAVQEGVMATATAYAAHEQASEHVLSDDSTDLKPFSTPDGHKTSER